MKIKKGIDLNIEEKEGNYFISLQSFPVSMFGNKPYRTKIIEDLKFKLSVIDFSIEELTQFVHKKINETKKDNISELIFFDPINDFTNKILNKSNNNTPKEIKKENITPAKQNDITNTNNVYIDFELHKESLLKTTEMAIYFYDSEADILSQRNLLKKDNIIYNSLKKSIHDIFIELLEPHIKIAQEEGKNVFIRSKMYNSPYIHSLNKHLQNNGLNKVSIKFKSNNQNEHRKEESILRIKEYMKNIYDDLTNLEDKYVCYCDGSSAEFSTSDKVLNSSAFIFREIGKQDVESVSRTVHANKEEQVFAEVNALVNAIDFIIQNDKTDKPISFVFDSNYVFKSFEALITGEEERFTEKTRHIFNQLQEKIKAFDIDINGVLLKSHQQFDFNNIKHEVVLYNEKVDKIAGKNIQKHLNKIDKITYT